MGEDVVRKSIAECIGTFILVFAGTAAFLSSGDYVFGFGFALIAIVYAIGHVSGAHVNPAVTLALAVTGKFPMMEVPYYWGSQLVGALVGSLLARVIFGGDGNLAATAVADGYSLLDGFLVEMIFSAIFLFVILAVATDKRSSPAVSGLAIGGTLLLIQVAAGEITGGSVNPFRSLAPAIVAGQFNDIWIYLIAPFIGAIIGAIGYEMVRGEGGLDLSAARTMVNDLPRPERPQRPARDPRRDPRQERGQRGGGRESQLQAQPEQQAPQRQRQGRQGQPQQRQRQRQGQPQQQQQRPPILVDQQDDIPQEHFAEYGDDRTGENLRQADDVPQEHLSERAQRPPRQRGAGAQGQQPPQQQRRRPPSPL